MTQNKKPSGNNQWLRYTSLGMEIMVLLALSVFGGLKLDDWLHLSPLFIITLPALALVWIFVRLYRQLVK